MVASLRWFGAPFSSIWARTADEATNVAARTAIRNARMFFISPPGPFCPAWPGAVLKSYWARRPTSFFTRRPALVNLLTLAAASGGSTCRGSETRDRCLGDLYEGPAEQHRVGSDEG